MIIIVEPRLNESNDNRLSPEMKQLARVEPPRPHGYRFARTRRDYFHDNCVRGKYACDIIYSHDTDLSEFVFDADADADAAAMPCHARDLLTGGRRVCVIIII